MESDMKPYQVRAVVRALELLGCFTPDESEQSLGQLAERTGLCASTTYRLLQTLESRRYVEQDPNTGRYRLGMACVQLGDVAVRQMDLRDRLRPLLVELRNEFREAVHLAILDPFRMEVIYVDKLDGLLPIGIMSSSVGRRAPGHCTGLGKCLLAFANAEEVLAHYRETPPRRYTPNTIADVGALLEELGEIRRQGYAVDNVEHEPDVKCIAVPVHDHTRAVVCSISVAGPQARMDTLIEHEGLVERMQRLAVEASSRLGYSKEP